MSLFRQMYAYLWVGLLIQLIVASELMATRPSSSNETTDIVEESVVLKRRFTIQIQPEELATNSEAAEKDFDQIRQFHSYDPKTGEWSAIEDFKTVKILEDTNIQPENDNYLYYNFWAYDRVRKQWYKVHIPPYGYRHKLNGENIGATPEQEEDEKASKMKRDSAWKHLRLDFSVGGGGTWYEHKAQGLTLLVEGQEYFLQTPQNSTENTVHRINWFTKPYTKQHRIFIHPTIYNTQAQGLAASKPSFSFRGLGPKLPITLTLHYTFFNRLRIGAGSTFEIHYLKKLYPTGQPASIAAYALRNPWLYTWKWFGMLGYKITDKPTSAIVMDIRMGRVYDVGSNLKLLWPISKIHYLYTNWYVNLGIAYEKKLNRHLRFHSRLSGDYKNYEDNTYFAVKQSSVQLYHIGLQLETGVSFNFAKDTVGENIHR